MLQRVRGFSSKESPYAASSSGNKNREKFNKDNVIVFWCCNKRGPNKGDLYKQKRKEGNKKGPRRPCNVDRGRVFDDTVMSEIAALAKSDTKEDKAMSA